MPRTQIPTFEEYLQLDTKGRREVRLLQKSMGQHAYSAKKGLPSPLKGRPMLNARGPRGPYPHRWLVGPDILRHEQYVTWARHRAQAHFRGEDYALTFHDFETIWQGHWLQRGRSKDSLVLTRQDPELPWCRGNIELIERRERIRRTGQEIRLRNL